MRISDWSSDVCSSDLTELTQAAFAGARGDGNPDDVLSKSWRSRPGIIEFANAMFSDAFERMGLPAAQHAFSGAARSHVGFDRPPLAWWPLVGKARSEEHTSELQSLMRISYAVFCLKKKNNQHNQRRALSRTTENA